MSEEVKCKYCDYNGKDRRSLIYHIKTKHEGFKCEYCDFKAYKMYLLEEHKGINHGSCGKDCCGNKAKQRQ